MCKSGLNNGGTCDALCVVRSCVYRFKCKFHHVKNKVHRVLINWVYNK